MPSTQMRLIARSATSIPTVQLTAHPIGFALPDRSSGVDAALSASPSSTAAARELHECRSRDSSQATLTSGPTTGVHVVERAVVPQRPAVVRAYVARPWRREGNGDRPSPNSSSSRLRAAPAASIVASRGPRDAAITVADADHGARPARLSAVIRSAASIPPGTMRSATSDPRPAAARRNATQRARARVSSATRQATYRGGLRNTRRIRATSTSKRLRRPARATRAASRPRSALSCLGLRRRAEPLAQRASSCSRTSAAARACGSPGGTSSPVSLVSDTSPHCANRRRTIGATRSPCTPKS